MSTNRRSTETRDGAEGTDAGDLEPDAPPVSLLPLSRDLHVEALQRVYELSHSYWDRYGLPSAPDGQGARDLEAIEADPGRHALGILLPNEPGTPAAGAQLVGLIDFRLHWPQNEVAYIGMLLVAEPFQGRGIARAAWRLLERWLRTEAEIRTVRVGVEQFSPDAMKFLEKLGFALTGESQRIKSGKRLVRLLQMERHLESTGT